MSPRKNGSNQHKETFKYPLGMSKGTFYSIIFLIVFAAAGLFGMRWYEYYWRTHIVISPLSDNPWVSQVQAKEPTPTPTPEPTLENIIAYITKKFEPEGKDAVIWAINCFYSESGLRPEAYHFNTNGTEDRGVAQINSIHGLTPQEAHTFTKNIDKAYEIYKRRGTDAWYGPSCN